MFFIDAVFYLRGCDVALDDACIFQFLQVLRYR